MAQGLLQQAMAFISEVAQQGTTRWGRAPTIVLTGGDGGALLPGLRRRLPGHAVKLEPELVLEGLRALGEIHCGHPQDSLNSSPRRLSSGVEQLTCNEKVQRSNR